MRKLIFLITLVHFMLLSSCKFSFDVDTKKKTDDDKAVVANAVSPEMKVLNGIAVDAKEVKVSQAYLYFEDGTLVPKSNEINVNQKVKMRLVVDNGWKVNNGKVSLGASEKITTSNGDVVLDAPDLFQSVGELKAEDANYITLSATISQLDKLYDYFLVSYRVWDKNGKGEITGNYKLYLKQ